MPFLFNSTQTTKPQLLDGVKPLFRDIMNDATKYYSKGPYSYNKSLVAPFAQSSRNAFAGMKDLAAANSGGAGMSSHLQSIMDNGGFNQGQLDSMGQMRGLANNSGLLDLINGNGLTAEQNRAYGALQDTVYHNNANLQRTFDQGGLTDDQHLVADRYRSIMQSPFDLNANPAYAQVRQSALDAGAQAVNAQAAKMGRFGGGANQNILSRNQMETAGNMDYGEYRNWQDQGNQAAGGLAALSQQGIGNQFNINSAQQAGLQNIANMGAMGVDQRNTAIGTKAGLENSLFNMGQAGLSNMGQAYDTAMQPFYTQRAVGQEYENKRQQIIDDKYRRFQEQNPFTHISNYLSLATGAPRGETQTTTPSPGQIAFGTGTGLLAMTSAMRNWGTPMTQPPQGSYGTGIW